MSNILSINDSDVGYFDEDFLDEVVVIRDTKIILKKEVVEAETESEVELLA